VALPDAQALYVGLCGAIMAKHSVWEGTWEPTVAEYLYALGRSEDMQCQTGPTTANCPRPETNSHEWLWDFLLTKGKVGADGFQSVELACEYECQASLPAIRYDFQKLLASKSPKLIFVGFAGTTYERSVRPRLEALKSDVRNYPLDEDQELLAVIVKEPGRGDPAGSFGTAYGLAFTTGREAVELGPTVLIHSAGEPVGKASGQLLSG